MVNKTAVPMHIVYGTLRLKKNNNQKTQIVMGF